VFGGASQEGLGRLPARVVGRRCGMAVLRAVGRGGRHGGLTIDYSEPQVGDAARAGRSPDRFRLDHAAGAT
jgi:hypothetical protein